VILLLDAGNSAIKWARWAGGELAGRGEVEVEDGEPGAALARSWAGIEAVDAATGCSVARLEVREAIAALARRRWAVEVAWVGAEREAHGVRCAYPEPATLGADRWAALIAAHRRCPAGAAILDCGTALTLDALGPGGQHLGGLICPGLGLMREALTRRAPGIPEVPAEGSTLFARSTAEAVAGGALHAAAALAERFAAALEARLGRPVPLLVTGGNGARVAAALGRPHQRVPDLVLEGLAVIAGAGR